MSPHFWPTSWILLKQLLFLSPSWPLSQEPIRPLASWAIESEPIWARGIIVNNYLYPCEIELIFTVSQDVQTIQTFEKNLNKSNVWKEVKCQIEHEFEGNQVYFIQVHQFDDMWLQFLHSKRKNIRFKIPQRFEGFSLGKKTLWCHFIVGVLDWLTYW